MSTTESKWRRLTFPLAASLTLGLAPFSPEPHIVGKLRWLAGGGTGMEFPDYFDVLLHGLPWVWLIVVFVQTITKKEAAKNH